jgi:hypothetical protein
MENFSYAVITFPDLKEKGKDPLVKGEEEQEEGYSEENLPRRTDGKPTKIKRE